MPPEEIKRLRELRESWNNCEIDYLDYAQQCGDALPSLLDEVEKLRRENQVLQEGYDNLNQRYRFMCQISEGAKCE